MGKKHEGEGVTKGYIFTSYHGNMELRGFSAGSKGNQKWSGKKPRNRIVNRSGGIPEVLGSDSR